MKRFIAFLLALMMLTASVSAVDLYIDTVKLDTTASPTIIDGRTMVPLRPIFESLGATVIWDQATKTSVGEKDNIQIIVQADNPTAYINGVAYTLDIPAQIINGYMMVPARFIAEALNYEISWYADTQVAAIAKELKEQKIYASKNQKTFHYFESCELELYEISLAETIGCGLKSCPICVPTEIDFSKRVKEPSNPPTSPTSAAPTNAATNQTATPSTPAKPSTTTNTPAKPSTEVVVPVETPTQNQSRTVYYTRTGECYHYKSNCGRGTYYPTTLESAIASGLRPCKKCT